jgi:hypothetical protein
MVKQFSDILRAETERGVSAKYCAITAMIIENTRSKCSHNLYDDHISVQKSQEDKFDMSQLTEEQKLEA